MDSGQRQRDMSQAMKGLEKSKDISGASQLRKYKTSPFTVRTIFQLYYGLGAVGEDRLGCGCKYQCVPSSFGHPPKPGSNPCYSIVLHSHSTVL